MQDLIWVELGLIPGYQEKSDGSVKLESLTFLGSKINLLPYMNDEQAAAAQDRLESMVEQAHIDKALAIRDKRDMRGDSRREMILDIQRETMAELQAQRGARA